MRVGLIDLPNVRSSHVVPTPRGGGIGIVVGICVAGLALAACGRLAWQVAALCAGAGGAVALIGYIDDRRGLPARVRFLVHMVAAAAVVALTWPWAGAMSDGWLGGAAFVVFWILAIGWLTNLYNFMDGIDGLAGSEAVFVFGGAAALSFMTGSPSGWTALFLAMSLGVAGFLCWNWPPARIFMGDVGSGFLGFMVGSLALATWVDGVLSPFTWLVLVSLFVADATVTLLRRFARRERWYSAHRSHAYQWLSRTRLGHAGVTRLSWAWNIAVVLPAAWWTLASPEHAIVVTAAVLVVSFGLAAALGAGRRESPSS